MISYLFFVFYLTQRGKITITNNCTIAKSSFFWNGVCFKHLPLQRHLGYKNFFVPFKKGEKADFFTCSPLCKYYITILQKSQRKIVQLSQFGHFIQFITGWKWRFLNIFLSVLYKKYFLTKIMEKVLTNRKNSDIIVKRSVEEDMAE